MNIDKSILERTIDTQSSRPSEVVLDFWKTVKTKLPSPEVITEFFYVGRGSDIGPEEFKDSCESLMSEEYDFQCIFQEIAEKSGRIPKEEFRNKAISHFQVLESNKSQKVLGLLRNTLKKKYKTFQNAANELASTGSVRTEEVLAAASVKQDLSMLPECLTRYQLKQLWYNREEVCCVDSCVEATRDYDYCSQHFKGALLRGEEALGKITAIVSPEKCGDLVKGLLQTLKRNTPFTFAGIHKRDIQALQIYLKYKQDKKAMSLSSTPYGGLN